MADASYTAPQQPGLRPFIVYDSLPAGMAAYPVMDGDSEPLLSLGEMVVVDPTDFEPEIGELFLIQWQGSPTPRLVEMWPMPKHPQYWCVGPVKQPEWVAGTGARWADFPYTDALLADRLLGRVIGILQPVYDEPKRLEAA